MVQSAPLRTGEPHLPFPLSEQVTSPDSLLCTIGVVSWKIIKSVLGFESSVTLLVTCYTESCVRSLLVVKSDVYGWIIGVLVYALLTFALYEHRSHGFELEENYCNIDTLEIKALF